MTATSAVPVPWKKMNGTGPIYPENSHGCQRHCTARMACYPSLSLKFFRLGWVSYSFLYYEFCSNHHKCNVLYKFQVKNFLWIIESRKRPETFRDEMPPRRSCRVRLAVDFLAYVGLPFLEYTPWKTMLIPFFWKRISKKSVLFSVQLKTWTFRCGCHTPWHQRLWAACMAMRLRNHLFSVFMNFGGYRSHVLPPLRSWESTGNLNVFPFGCYLDS